jgi:hypothetical protein
MHFGSALQNGRHTYEPDEATTRAAAIGTTAHQVPLSGAKRSRGAAAAVDAASDQHHC